jgi:hypothetical protein
MSIFVLFEQKKNKAIKEFNYFLLVRTCRGTKELTWKKRGFEKMNIR